jgi:sodium/hydrogen exchanger-like protein 6/7
MVSSSYNGRTLDRFEKESVTFPKIMGGFASFFGVFMGSCLIGVVVALLAALFLRYTDLRRFPVTESCFVTLVAYITYLMSNSIDMSGIVSLLFCAITMKHYMYLNLSRKSRRMTRYLFHIVRPYL